MTASTGNKKSIETFASINFPRACKYGLLVAEEMHLQLVDNRHRRTALRHEVKATRDSKVTKGRTRGKESKGLEGSSSVPRAFGFPAE